MGKNRMKIFFSISIFILSTVFTFSAISQDVPNSVAEEGKTRPEKWAVPIEKEGIPNLHKVSDQLYRSAQPTEEGMKRLKELGVKTIVSLRALHSDKDKIEDSGEKFNYEHIYMKTWHPEKEDIVKFLKIVSDPDKTPVIVHCQHGADRTGTMCAVYRIVVQNWTKEDALKEMKDGAYNFHKIWANLETFIKELDIDSLKKDLTGKQGQNELDKSK